MAHIAEASTSKPSWRWWLMRPAPAEWEVVDETGGAMPSGWPLRLLGAWAAIATRATVHALRLTGPVPELRGGILWARCHDTPHPQMRVPTRPAWIGRGRSHGLSVSVHCTVQRALLRLIRCALSHACRRTLTSKSKAKLWLTTVSLPEVERSSAMNQRSIFCVLLVDVEGQLGGLIRRDHNGTGGRHFHDAWHQAGSHPSDAFGLPHLFQ